MKRFIEAMMAGTMIFSLAECGRKPTDGGLEKNGKKKDRNKSS